MSLEDRILELEKRVKKLEEENIELTNTLYEIENKFESELDKLIPRTYTLHNYSLGDA